MVNRKQVYSNINVKNLGSSVMNVVEIQEIVTNDAEIARYMNLLVLNVVNAGI